MGPERGVLACDPVQSLPDPSRHRLARALDRIAGIPPSPQACRSSQFRGEQGAFLTGSGCPGGIAVSFGLLDFALNLLQAFPVRRTRPTVERRVSRSLVPWSDLNCRPVPPGGSVRRRRIRQSDEIEDVHLLTRTEPANGYETLFVTSLVSSFL